MDVGKDHRCIRQTHPLAAVAPSWQSMLWRRSDLAGLACRVMTLSSAVFTLWGVWLERDAGVEETFLA